MRTNVGTARQNHPPNGRNHLEQNQHLSWSGQQDSNLRPGVPKTPALPDCAIPRQGQWARNAHAGADKKAPSHRYTLLPTAAMCSGAAPPSTPIGEMRDRPCCRQRQRRKIGVATRSPGSMPSFRAVPAATSRTARTCPPEGMILSDSVSVFSAIRRMRPSLWMKIMSRDT